MRIDPPTVRIPDRHSGLDALRGVATVLVVVLHAAVPYTAVAMPGLTWPVRQHGQSPLVDGLFWTIEGAIMPLFFWMSGYGAVRSLNAHGLGAFLRLRWARIGVPLLLGIAVILPCELYVWMLGWVVQGELPAYKLRTLCLGPYHRDLWGLSHLWYLEYLLLFCGMLAAAKWTLGGYFEREHEAHHRRRAILADWWNSPARVAVLAVLSSAILWWQPKIVVGFQHSFFPVLGKCGFSGLFFSAGMMTAASGRASTRWGWPRMLLSPFALWAVLPLVHADARGAVAGADRIVLATGLGCYAAFMTTGAWDWAYRYQMKSGPVIRLVAASSYWTYLTHHPLTAVWHIALRDSGLAVEVQCVLTVAGTLAWCMASYVVLVRKTWIGAILEGRSAIPKTPTAEAAVPLRRAA